MSFFDDDEPTRAAPRAGAARPRPRRPAPAAPGGGLDDQTLLTRRLAAAGIALLVLILLVFGVKGCLDSRRESSLKDYTRGVSAVMLDSQQTVATPLFNLLNQGADQPQDLQGIAQQLRLAAEEQVKQAKGLSVPGGLERAQGHLLLVLNLRAQAIAKIADRIPGALAQGRANAQTAEAAVDQIAGQMRAFDASDVVYSQRVRPEIEQELRDADVNVPALPNGQFLPDVKWLDPDEVAGVLGSQRAGGGVGANPNPPAGLHGHGITSAAVGSQTLQPKPAVNHIAAGSNVSFSVAFMNQGDFDEREVVVKVTVAAGTSKPITARKTVNTTTAHEAATATVALGQAPPTGKAATITVEVVKVPGEKNVSNNKQSFTAIFE